MFQQSVLGILASGVEKSMRETTVRGKGEGSDASPSGDLKKFTDPIFALKSFKIQLRHSQSYLLDLKSIYLLSAWSRNAPIFRIM